MSPFVQILIYFLIIWRETSLFFSSDQPNLLYILFYFRSWKSVFFVVLLLKCHNKKDILFLYKTTWYLNTFKFPYLCPWKTFFKVAYEVLFLLFYKKKNHNRISKYMYKNRTLTLLFKAVKLYLWIHVLYWENNSLKNLFPLLLLDTHHQLIACELIIMNFW